MSKTRQAIVSDTVKHKTKYISVILAALLVFTAVPAYASASAIVNNNVAQPKISEAFAVSAATTGSYVEPTNGFTDGTAHYYLITQNSAKSAATTVTYQGTDYPLSGVYVGSDFSVASASGFFAANSTVFFDDGTYNDGDATAYTRFSAENLSLIGLNGASTTIITKSTHAADDTIERNILAAKNIYLQGITFDGLGKNLCASAGGTGYGKTRGDFLFYISGGNGTVVNGQTRYDGSDGLVMKDCIIQNVGATNSSNTLKNLAINIYQSDGQHNFDNLQIKNVNTCLDYGIVSMNHASNNYFKDLTIDGSLANSATYSVKIEAKSTSNSVPDNTFKNVFSGLLSLTHANNTDNIYIQKYEFKSTVVPAEYRYAQYSNVNGTDYASAINVYSVLPAASSTKAVLDVHDNYWIVRSGDVVPVEDQLKAIKAALAAARAAGTTPPSTNIKLVSSNGSIGAFTVPDFGADDNVNIVAVDAATDGYDSTALIPMSAAAAIILPTVNADKIKLYNFDFDTNLKYTLQKVTNGIDPSNVTLSDPYETISITGYPIYSAYKPTAIVPAKIVGSTAATFANCKFTSLANEIKIANTDTAITVGKSDTFTAQLKDSDTNSYTAAGYSTNVKSTANDQTINWFSSDSSIVSIDQITGKATAIKTGNVTIIAKAMDGNNNGEIEKPFDTLQLSVSADNNTTTGSGSDITIPDNNTPTGSGSDITTTDNNTTTGSGSDITTTDNNTTTGSGSGVIILDSNTPLSSNPSTGDHGEAIPLAIGFAGLLTLAGITLKKRLSKKIFS